jgi:Ca2+-binding RTX toxin-like protein
VSKFFKESYIDLDDLEDLFKDDFSVAVRSDSSWQYAFTSGDAEGYQLTLSGTGLAGTGVAPLAGVVEGIAITGGTGVVFTVSGLSIPAAVLADAFDLVGDTSEDEDEDSSEDEDDEDEEDEDEAEDPDDDDLYGGDDDDEMDGGNGDDDIDSGDGDDDLDGGDGDDDLDGGDGDDDLHGGRGDDSMAGGAGEDTADYSHASKGVKVSLALGKATGEGRDSLSGIENAMGSRRHDVLAGDDGANELDGGKGNDRLSGGGGADDLRGDVGNDRLAGGEEEDALDGGKGNDRLDGGAGDDRLAGGIGNDVLAGGLGADVFAFAERWKKDTIADFEQGADVIDLRGLGLSFDDLEIRYDDDRALIRTDEGKIDLADFSGTLGSDDFLF